MLQQLVITAFLSFALPNAMSLSVVRPVGGSIVPSSLFNSRITRSLPWNKAESDPIFPRRALPPLDLQNLVVKIAPDREQGVFESRGQHLVMLTLENTGTHHIEVVNINMDFRTLPWHIRPGGGAQPALQSPRVHDNTATLAALNWAGGDTITLEPGEIYFSGPWKPCHSYPSSAKLQNAGS